MKVRVSPIVITEPDDPDRSGASGSSRPLSAATFRSRQRLRLRPPTAPRSSEACRRPTTAENCNGRALLKVRRLIEERRTRGKELRGSGLETWRAVQAVVPTRKRLRTKIERPFPLVGLVACGGCGHGSLLKFTSTRAAFARPVPGASRSPTSQLVCGPPTPRSHRWPASVSLAGRLPRCGRFFFASVAGGSCARERAARRRLLSGSPFRRSVRGETWASQVPGSSSSCVPWSYTPPDAAFPRLLPYREDRCCLQVEQSPGHPE
jgi:hypothetical protein